MNKKIYISLATGVILSAIGLSLAFRNVPLDELFGYFSRINYFYIIPTILIMLLAFVVRTVRWQIILGTTHRLSFSSVYHPLMIGFMLNLILPGRVGELARPAILKKKEGVPFVSGLATVAAERLFDLLMLLIMLVYTLSVVEIDPSLSIPFGEYRLNKETLETIAEGMVKMGILLLSGIILVIIEKTRVIIIKIIHLLPLLLSFSASLKKKTRKQLCPLLEKTVHNIAASLAVIKDVKRLVLCLILSVVVWFLAALTYYVMMLGCPGINLGFFEIFAVLIIICFFIALPSVPGFWGLWEAGGVFALTLFGVPASIGASYTLANHVIQVVPLIIIGFVSAIITGINIMKIETNPSSDS